MDRMAEMEIFVAVVDSGGFTEAANKLRLSKSSVSKPSETRSTKRLSKVI